ncbi:nuclear transport factor 2 family protein [Bradyrhizobium sp. U87765 SZCCT0131]|uniref:nuclear transport factor 2 family protein n=1 Tax=unclassified Bradyrhizobium TaxID=2631580 RepID=UPI001BABC26C|nr:MULTISPECIES: nuclear transport factor 2 family protein [unclassified Bradyrhizobium]MBR1218431.1 nuclear transport factor 2 family protein [Bradyrhizobium sp. U87765 SZCCT0131]MBR1260623.1 nuclear transport factor 2 family protein [Bradyrhizobium sp. U87765 SZCCT0134]MBR1303929.1 nuclear transport factor 2 family protein [Bradyrhizobium sp. U87765 SZCCT0110]MBR1319535.1 nuclear transport factor 2 family protein [Bradyrhizobium sp. U87765 SZCCT0109]MBR1347860.1 nuclear transport factor 2 fa
MNDLAVGDDFAEGLDTRALLERYWKAIDSGNFELAHRIYHEDALLDVPQTGERISGRDNIKASRGADPQRATITVRSLLGQGDLWVTDYTTSYDGEPEFVVSIMELRDGKIARETLYFAEPLPAPRWRAKWAAKIP